MFVTVADLEAKIEEDMRLTSTEYHNDAWADGQMAGIQPEIMAEAAFVTALRQLGKDHSEEELLSLMDALRERIEAGEFLAMRTHH